MKHEFCTDFVGTNVGDWRGRLKRSRPRHDRKDRAQRRQDDITAQTTEAAAGGLTRCRCGGACTLYSGYLRLH